MSQSESEDKLKCAECNQVIDGEVVWYRPFGDMVQKGQQVWQFIAQASTEEMPNSLPFHPRCFEKRTGEKWPPKSK